MSEPDTYSSPRYLRAKKTVDARALNRQVWTQFIRDLTKPASSPIRILEVGGVIGATVERIVEVLGERSVDALRYTFVDIEPETVEAARETLRTWARNRGYRVS